jgi:hypothetical protein
MTVGSFAFQLGLQAGWFNGVMWIAPWAWGASAAMWLWWIITHPKIENEWLQSIHVRLGAKVHPIRIALCLVVLACVSLGIRALVKRQGGLTAPQASRAASSTKAQNTQAPESSKTLDTQDVPSSPPAKISPKPPHKPKQKADKNTAPPIQPHQPPITQDCGGGNCAASVGQQGGVTAGQININGPLPPHVNWKQDPMAAGTTSPEGGGVTYGYEQPKRFVDNPGLALIVSLDKSWPNVILAAECDGPCETEAVSLSGVFYYSIGRSQQGNVVGIRIEAPSVLPVGTVVHWEIRSFSAQAITIKNVTLIVR